MTRLSTQEGTLPSRGHLVRWHRRRSGLDNRDLIQPIASGQAAEVRRLLQRPGRELDEPYQASRHAVRSPAVRFTPLEHAVDKGNSSEVVELLLRAGASVTLPTLTLALDGVCHDWGDPIEDDYDECRHEEDFDRALHIFDLLSATGVDWPPVIAAYRVQCAGDAAMLTRLDALEPRRQAFQRSLQAQETPPPPARRSRLRSRS